MTNHDNTRNREARARRAAKRQGLQLRKSRSRSPHMHDLLGYRLDDPNRNTVVAGEDYELSLENVEARLELGEDWPPSEARKG
ncbi:MAG: hypothetical protein ACYC5O_03820 [Anaerolineae bacterium]